MTFRPLTAARAAFENSAITGMGLLVFLSLVDHADADGACHPSVARIAERTGLSRRTVQIHLRALARDGFVQVQHRLRGDGRHNSSLYRLCISCIGAADAPMQDMRTPAQDVRPGGAAGAGREGAADAPEVPISEVPIEGVVGRPAHLDYLADFNAVAERRGWQPLRSLTRKRREHLRAREAEPVWDWPALVAELERVSDSWVQGFPGFGFDWLIANDTNHVKVLEGKYRDRKPARIGADAQRPAAHLGRDGVLVTAEAANALS